jgi:hypothetical protein
VTIFQQKNTKEKSTFLAVNPGTFAELIGENESHYVFRFSFKMLIDEYSKIFDYSYIKVTVKRKQDDEVSESDENGNTQSEVQLKVPNPVYESLVRPGKGRPRPKYSEKVQNKLFSNLKMIVDSQKQEPNIGQADISLSDYLSEVRREVKYKTIELYQRSYKPERLEYSTRNLLINKRNVDNSIPTLTSVNPSEISPTSILTRLNRELCSITEPFDDESILKLDSEVDLEDPSYRMDYVSRGKRPLYFDIIKYLLREIPQRPDESKTTWYEKREVTKKFDYVMIDQDIQISKLNLNMNLTVRFDLFKPDECLPSESLNVDLYVPTHVNAFENHIKSPEVTVLQTPMINKSDPGMYLNSICITDKNESGRVSSFNVYAKTIDDRGSVRPFTLIGQVQNKVKTNLFNFSGTSDLICLRVIPVLTKSNKEANVFSDKVVGPGYKAISSVSILPYHTGRNEIRINVYGLPEQTMLLSLYRRDCTDNFNSTFSLIQEYQVSKRNILGYFLDRQVNIGRTYEYYVVATVPEKDTGEEVVFYSNLAIYNHIPNSLLEKDVVVDLTDSSYGENDGTLAATFKLKTIVSKTENERITQSLKDQIGELYEQYLNPLSNSNSPLGVDEKGIPRYSDLFFHEIVRTNLTTGERETFDLVSDGEFKDNSDTQRIFNIKPLDPFHTYYYHVFTFRKNPVDLFKNFVVRGIDEKGKEWFYLPFKWLNSSVKRGKLYADDEKGIPVVSAYESFTSEAYGLTASFRADGSVSLADVDQISVQRIDRNTNKLTWNFKSSSNIKSIPLYDSFLVMKVVNGIRKIVGKTQDSYIYHELTSEDLGSIYYIIVPITADYKIDKPAYSSDLLITPDGIAEKIKVIN